VAWLEIIFEVEREQVEPWSDTLLELGALSINAQDADAESLDEQPIFGEPGMPHEVAWERNILSALVDDATDPDVMMRAVANQLDDAMPAYRVVQVREQDWVRVTQAQFEPFAVGEKLWITPSWTRTPTANRLEIVVDPGLAFGTGSHPTTKLCLRWLEQHMPVGARVIDYGCGTGILAIAAGKLGAGELLGIDIDPQALQASRYNAQVNGQVLAVQDTRQALPAAADIVVANILSTPLKLLAPLLASLVKPGGWLVMSGVLERQIDEVAAAYQSILPVRMAACDEGWACLAGQRSSHTSA
jgi:ribosomal protein L11 methyltransferase